MFILGHPLEQMELQAVDPRDYGHLLRAWGGFMQGRSTWTRLMEAAAGAQYDVVRAGLLAWFE